MVDIRLVREQPDVVRRAMQRRGLDPAAVDAVLYADAAYRETLQKTEASRAELNALSEQIGRGDASAREKARKQKEKLRGQEGELERMRTDVDRLLETIPNIPADDVPDGADANENVIVREGLSPRQFRFPPKDYLALAEQHDLVDMTRGARVAGARFGYLKREAALLELALVRYAFDLLVNDGFVPVIPPVMIRPEVYRGMGRLTEEQRPERYFLADDNLYLVGSAEHTLGPMHMDEVLEADALPIRYVGFSTCFRREAGSYGKDTRGILRVHQFDKVEMFIFAQPERSMEELERLAHWQERLMTGLALPHRVVAICTGDMGWTDAKQYDIEAWLPGENVWRETHSASNTTDFQARGINARFRPKSAGKPEFLHLLNATALAIGRTLIALLENHQQEDGTITIPEALRPYCGFDRIPNERVS